MDIEVSQLMSWPHVQDLATILDVIQQLVYSPTGWQWFLICWLLLGKIGRKDTPALLVIVLVAGRLPVGKSIFSQQKVNACVTGNHFSFSNQSQQLGQYKVFPLDQWLPTFWLSHSQNSGLVNVILLAVPFLQNRKAGPPQHTPVHPLH